MIRSLIVLAIISFSTAIYATRSPSTYFQLESDLKKVSMKNLVSMVNDFVQVSSPSRMVGLPGHEKARDFIVETIKKSDPKSSGKLSIETALPEVEKVKAFYQNDFDQKLKGKVPASSPEYQKWLKFTDFMVGFAERKKTNPVENIVWEKSGLNGKKVLVVTAHYDTISHDKSTLLVKEKDLMPGANYNGSGVAIALGLIKIMSDFNLNYTVQVVFLDWGGIGFHGSYLYAKELKKLEASGKEILGVINLESLGQDTSYFDKSKKTGNMSVYVRDQDQEVQWINKLIDHGKKVTDGISFEVKANGFENSDNVSFWDAGIRSATFSQNWEEDFNPKFYQTPQDTPETLNHKTLWNAYQYVGGVVIGTLLDITR